ncbi:HKD family nuclease [Duganella sp. 1411]|uniref:phospholipase D family protein n=1 Tax=Duganella sp. 1411 TaxID=2806572 RepID=UPI001AEAB018|nr:phospholipase D family protein [Duganella sp. 1411]MBP1202922.1 HKD family nuclease [Duganella sp. 1411]
MKVNMLTDTEATRAVVRLVRECLRFDVAVAWAGPNPAVEAMLEAHPKLGRVVIGTHMYQTDPKVLRRFIPHVGARCLPPDGRLFHPKVYLFKMAKGFAAVVGSHNLTGGAFGGRNIEVSVLLEGSADDEVFVDLTSFVKSSWAVAETIDEDDFLFPYETQYRINKAKRSALDKFHRLKKPRKGAKTSPMDVSWASFTAAVKKDGHHDFVGRLEILERASVLFKEHRSFSAMSQYERKAIAGTYGTKESQLDGLNWAWFGTMFGQGDFKNLVNESPELLSSALQNIPLEGDVSEAQFDAFVHDFDLAFQGKAHKGGVATASRLLAMKRPDFFVGLNNANRVGISEAFGTAPTTLNLGNYWERVVIPVQNSPWWLHSRPRDVLGGRIWDNRAALMDSIYYDPSIHQAAA